jgi:hypothetical protein
MAIVAFDGLQGRPRLLYRGFHVWPQLMAVAADDVGTDQDALRGQRASQRFAENLQRGDVVEELVDDDDVLVGQFEWQVAVAGLERHRRIDTAFPRCGRGVADQ